jgi:predicted DNA-binding protein
MPRPKRLDGQERLQMRISRELANYLDALAKKGVHGNTRPEVVRHLVGEAIVNLEDKGFFDKPPREPRRRKP